jgi:halogenation protein CepH
MENQPLKTDSVSFRESCIHGLFEKQARQRPDAVAVVYEDRWLSYGELNCRANRLAHYLRGRKVRPETRVGLCLERGLEMIIGVMGILKAGGAYVPLDPSYPPERLAHMASDAGIALLLTQSGMGQSLPISAEQRVEFDNVPEVVALGCEQSPEVGVGADNAAYVIYTSGTTGKSKGVVCLHRGVVNLAEAQIAAFRIDEDSRVLQFASLSFDAAVSEWCTALLGGAQLILQKKEKLLTELSDILKYATVVTLPPTVLDLLKERDVTTLETLVVAGEPCAKGLVEKYSRHVGRMLNGYGPTETTVCATMSGPLEPSEIIPIGKPIINTRAYVLDLKLEPIPPGEAGELFVAGVNLAREYLNQADLTAEKFLPDLSGDQMGERMYCTGDIVRWVGDELAYVGRTDTQIKLRGFRIELGEIESALKDHEGIKQAAVVLRDGAPGGKQLVGYVVRHEGQNTPTTDELKRYLRRRLPEYMVPGTIIELAGLPLTENNKVNRKKLSHPDKYDAAPQKRVIGNNQIWRSGGPTMQRDNMKSAENFDLIVVGGGPGGATLSTFVAMQNHRVLLLEKERFPRYQIGESLLPATVHGICVMLRVSEELKQANFTKKLGGVFRWGKNAEPWSFNFGDSRLMAGPKQFAYQVERSKFDEILLNNAKRHGVDVREGHKINDLIVEGGRVTGVSFTDSEGRERSAKARFVADASGNTSRIYHHAGERVYSKFFQNVALFCYFENGRRLPPPNDGSILCVAFKGGWFWYIPLSPTLTSVGVVMAREEADRLKDGHEAAMQSFIDSCPMIREYLANATRVVEGQYGQFRVRKDYSYCNTSFWKPGLVLVGDAACFIDPVFSSGVHLATYAALLAARSINTCLKGELDEELCFSEFEMRYRREFGNFYQFLIAIYDMSQDEESYFWAARKVLNTEEQTNEAFIRLVGGVSTSGEPLYSSAEEYFGARDGIGEWFASYAKDAAMDPDLSEKFKQKGFDPKKFMEGFTDEIAQVQIQAMVGGREMTQSPLFNRGLIPSSDGLHWAQKAQSYLSSSADHRHDLTAIGLAYKMKLERLIVSIWQNTLQIDHLDPNDNFFEAGGSSISAVMVKNQLQEALPGNTAVTNLAPDDVYKYQTASDLAAHLCRTLGL